MARPRFTISSLLFAIAVIGAWLGLARADSQLASTILIIALNGGLATLIATAMIRDQNRKGIPTTNMLRFVAVVGAIGVTLFFYSVAVIIYIGIMMTWA